MSTPHLIKGFAAATSIPRYGVVALSSADNSIALATDVGDPIIGVSAEPKDAPMGEVVDVILSGVAEVKANAAITVGTNLTVHTDGSVKASSAGTDSIIGRALSASAAQGDVITILINAS